MQSNRVWVRYELWSTQIKCTGNFKCRHNFKCNFFVVLLHLLALPFKGELWSFSLFYCEVSVNINVNVVQLFLGRKFILALWMWILKHKFQDNDVAPMGEVADVCSHRGMLWNKILSQKPINLQTKPLKPINW